MSDTKMNIAGFCSAQYLQTAWKSFSL